MEAMEAPEALEALEALEDSQQEMGRVLLASNLAYVTPRMADEGQ